MSDYEKFGIYGVNPTRGGNQAVKCPKCSESRKKKNMKSLSVNCELGTWNCHHCGETGSIKTGWKGDEHSASMHQVNAPRFEEKNVVIPKIKHQTELDDKQVDWFRKRGIKIATLQRNQITKEKVWMPQTNKDENCIAFNYVKDGEIVNIKYRDGRKNFRQVKDAQKVLYKLDDIKIVRDTDPKWCVICEGEMDALSYEEIGIKNAVSVPDGAPNPNAQNLENKFTYLESCATYLEKMSKFYISVDNDQAGVTLREELCRRLGRHKCWIVNYPEGCKDANDVLKDLGADALQKCFDEAEPYPIEDIILVKDFEDSIDRLYRQGMDKGERVGFNFCHSDKMKSFDELITFKTGMFMAVTGVPSHGKSNFVEQLIMLLNVNNGWKAGIFSPEHYPMEIMFSRVAKMYVGKQFFKGKEDRMSETELQRAKEHFNDNYYFIRPKDEKFTLDTVLEAAAGVILRYGVKTIVIDPWNTISHDKTGKSETDYTEEALNKINDFKQKYDVLVIVIAHPTKMKKQEDGTFETPTLYSISGSSHWYNKCDYGLIIYRDYANIETQAHIAKIKFEHLGEIGMALFKWNPQNSRYYPKGSEPYNKMYGAEESQSVIAIDPEPHEEITLENIPEDECPF